MGVRLERLGRSGVPGSGTFTLTLADVFGGGTGVAGTLTSSVGEVAGKEADSVCRGVDISGWGAMVSDIEGAVAGALSMTVQFRQGSPFIMAAAFN